MSTSIVLTSEHTQALVHEENALAFDKSNYWFVVDYCLPNGQVIQFDIGRNRKKEFLLMLDAHAK